jgi:urease accessory protein
MKRSLALPLFAGALLAGTSSLVAAHTGDAGHVHGAADALAAGFSHPFTGLDHLAVMVAVGLWSALTSRRLWLAPLVFAGTLLVGALLGLAGIAMPAVEPMIAASLLVLGLLVATRVQLPAAAGAALVAAFALFHGAAHGQELAGPSATFAIAGMVAATALLHAAGVGLGWALRERAAWLPRAGGAAIALFGAALLVS